MRWHDHHDWTRQEWGLALAYPFGLVFAIMIAAYIGRPGLLLYVSAPVAFVFGAMAWVYGVIWLTDARGGLDE